MNTSSPINIELMKGQNKILYNFLNSGKRINCFMAKDLGIGYLNSRISDLKNKNEIPIKSKFINVEGVSVKEYWIEK